MDLSCRPRIKGRFVTASEAASLGVHIPFCPQPAARQIPDPTAVSDHADDNLHDEEDADLVGSFMAASCPDPSSAEGAIQSNMDPVNW